MDDSWLMNLGMSSTGVAVVLILYRILKWANKKKFVSDCCGKKMEMSVAVVENVNLEQKETDGRSPANEHKAENV